VFINLQGQATDVQIRVDELMRKKKQLNDIYVKHTGQPYDVIGRYMSQHISLTRET